MVVGALVSQDCPMARESTPMNDEAEVDEGGESLLWGSMWEILRLCGDVGVSCELSFIVSSFLASITLILLLFVGFASSSSPCSPPSLQFTFFLV